MILFDQKPCLRNLQSFEVKENNLSESTKQQWSTDGCCQEMSIGRHLVVNKLATDSSPSLADEELSEGRSHEVFLAVSSVASDVKTPDADCLKESICQTATDEVLSTDTSSISALTNDSKLETEMKKLPNITDSTKVSKENDTRQLDVTSSELNDRILLDDPSVAVESAEKNTCIIQHSLFFEEISNDGMENNEKDTEDKAEVHDVNMSNSVLSACWAASFPAVSNIREGIQKDSFSKTVPSDYTAFSLALSSSTASVRSSSVMPVMSSSSAPESSAAVSLCSALTAPLPSVLSTQHTASTDFSSTLNTSTAAKGDAASSAFSHSVALTLYKDGSVKLQPTLGSGLFQFLSSF